jgi:hypothetical protein
MQLALHDDVEAEKASTFTFVPLDRLLRVDNATTCTVFTDLVPRSATDLRVAFGAYWSMVVTRRPFTNTANFPCAGPATYHMANVFRLRENDALAPVVDAARSAPPCAVRLFPTDHAVAVTDCVVA